MIFQASGYPIPRREASKRGRHPEKIKPLSINNLRGVSDSLSQPLHNPAIFGA
jgi:hypothetical protein